MLGPIAMVTTCVADLAQTEEAYHRDLGYRIVEHGQVPDWQARLWGAPAAAGAKTMTMRPEKGPQPGHDFQLRFVEAPPPSGFRAMGSYGWTATEILAQDPDALAKRLEKSAFTIVGEPKPLAGFTAIKAMQVQGPSGEILYLTNIAGEIPRLGKPEIPSFVDRCFIAVLATPDLEASTHFYTDGFGYEVEKIYENVELSVANKNRGAPPETRYRFRTIHFDGQSVIEVDEYPKDAGPRPLLPNGLPAGMAIVSFVADAKAMAKATPVEGRGPGHEGKRYAMLRGAAGEWVELVQG